MTSHLYLLGLEILHLALCDLEPMEDLFEFVYELGEGGRREGENKSEKS
jgi:hypothetical protein